MDSSNIPKELQELATEWGIDVLSPEFPKKLDLEDPLKENRLLFHIPEKQEVQTDSCKTPKSGESIYLVGNSLGLQPKALEGALKEELDSWKKWGVQGHFRGKSPWVSVDEIPRAHMAELVGAQVGEVAVMGSLSTNIHLMMVPFYRPTEKRHKIIIENGAFPSDLYIATSQIEAHERNIQDSLIQLKPREFEHHLRTEDIIQAINDAGDELALVLLPGVQYYTGQVFEMKTITEATHKVGANSGWDLAHAVGNIDLHLHEWNVDFACWCTYKYLNSGPGGIGGLFIHSSFDDKNLKRFAGWWGHDSATRFNMDRPFNPIPGAFGFRHSNPSVFTTMALASSLEIYHKVGMAAFLKKQKLLTSYLEYLLEIKCADTIKVITPKDARGCQLSLVCIEDHNPTVLEEKLFDEGVVCDIRGKVIRAAPTPLYNSFYDLYDFVEILKTLITKT